MSIRLRQANSITGKLLRVPANALPLMLALGTAAALHAQQAADKSPAGTYSLLYSFQCSPDGETPSGGLIRDSSGNLYGTTNDGGQYGYGTVFKLTSSGTESVLHSFGGSPSDGGYPEFGTLTLDAAENVYGVTPNDGQFGYGTVFEVTATGNESVLYNFTGGADGANPSADVARDSSDNLYGTAASGGTYGKGVLFKLTPAGAETVLHNFGSSSSDGAYPTSNLTPDSSGNLYGTTSLGGTSSAGTVFEVAAHGGESVLYSFKGPPSDGASPDDGGLLRDAAGNLYGVTLEGGANGGISGAGVVFELSAGGTESVLLNFNGTTGGKWPIDGLARDAVGNLYGTTSGGPSVAGCPFGCGVLFALTTADKEIVLHHFTGNSSSDGFQPASGVVRDPSGNLYGTLSYGGGYGCGAVFKFTP
jgi:uncharacterized repeat protein (TIGR03803 family)